MYLGRESLFCLPRLRGDRASLVDFRHVIIPLLRKPGAFIHYRHRQALYPSTVFRAAYDRLVLDHSERSGVVEYLQILKLATEEGLDRVETSLKEQLKASGKWRASHVRERLVPAARKLIELSELTPTLAPYDALLEGEVARVG